jgi:hypothetical protein
MNLSKLLWTIAGFLGVIFAGVTGFVMFDRQEIEQKVTQMPIQNTEKQEEQKVVQLGAESTVIQSTSSVVAKSISATPSSVQKAKPTVSVSGDTLSQFKNITSWITTEDFVIWKNYYTFSQKINDALRAYPDGQMITISKRFNPNSIEQKKVIDAVFASLTKNNWKRIADSYATDFVRFDQYLYEKNNKPLVLTIEKIQFEKEQMVVQIDFLK